MKSYPGHLQYLRDNNLLTVKDGWFSEEEVSFLKSFAENQAAFKDRSSFQPNVGVDGEVGKYYSAGLLPTSHPELWKKIFSNKTINGFEPIEVMINEYEPGAFIPPHKDGGLAIYTVVVPLQTGDSRLVFGDPSSWYNDMAVEESDAADITVSFPDVAGTGYQFNGTSPIHWVPPVTELRHSLIMLYGLPL